jgi:hypothetical protein
MVGREQAFDHRAARLKDIAAIEGERSTATMVVATPATATAMLPWPMAPSGYVFAYGDRAWAPAKP